MNIFKWILATIASLFIVLFCGGILLDVIRMARLDFYNPDYIIIMIHIGFIGFVGMAGLCLSLAPFVIAKVW